jgi:hypothetical protein
MSTSDGAPRVLVDPSVNDLIPRAMLPQHARDEADCDAMRLADRDDDIGDELADREDR